jgi:NAD(P)H dehydrogenase (quinone)
LTGACVTRLDVAQALPLFSSFSSVAIVSCPAVPLQEHWPVQAFLKANWRKGMRIAIGLAILAGGICFQVTAVRADDPVHGVRVLVAYYSMTGNTEKMARGVAEGAESVKGAVVLLKRVEQVTAEDLFGTDALVVGSPVYWSNMAGPVKTFFDNWQLKFGVYPEFKMRNKVGAAFATGGQVSSGKEVAMLTMLAAMLGNHMIVVSGGGAFGASATTEGNSPGIDDQEMADAKALGQRVAEVTTLLRKGMRN